MHFPTSGTWGTMYSPLLWHFYKDDSSRLCDGSTEVQYTPGRAPSKGPRCPTCVEAARQRRAVYGRANAGTTGREHWPRLFGPAY